MIFPSVGPTPRRSHRQVHGGPRRLGSMWLITVHPVCAVTPEGETRTSQAGPMAQRCSSRSATHYPHDVSLAPENSSVADTQHGRTPDGTVTTVAGSISRSFTATAKEPMLTFAARGPRGWARRESATSLIPGTDAIRRIDLQWHCITELPVGTPTGLGRDVGLRWPTGMQRGLSGRSGSPTTATAVIRRLGSN